MSTTLLLNSINDIGYVASQVSYRRILGNNRVAGQSTEAFMTDIWRTAGTLTNLCINITANDRAASTFRTRKGTANANILVDITGSTTGKFEDITNSDVVSAGDDWHAVITIGSGGSVFSAWASSILFAANTNTVHRIGGSPSGTAINLASVTNPGSLYGNGDWQSGAADSLVGETVRTSGTLKNLYVYVSANARTTTTTFKSRVNSAAGALTLDVTAGATGSFEDTANTDTISSGDLINWAATTGTGTQSLTARIVAVDFITTNGNFQFVNGTPGGTAQAAGVTTYYSIAGTLSTSTTEANTALETNLIFTASKLQCNISANTIVLNSTLKSRKNSGAGNQTVDITALTTGIFQDASNSDTYIATDTADYQVVTPSTATSITIRSISMLANSTVSSGVTKTQAMCLMGIQ